MKWYYTKQGIHVKVRVFMNGANCGTLTFRVEEFEEIKAKALRASPSSPIYSFINEDETNPVISYLQRNV
jgi:hypothetical protein